MDEHGVDSTAQVVDEYAENAERNRDGDGDLGGHASLDRDGNGDERSKAAVGRNIATSCNHTQVDHLDAAACDQPGLEVARQQAENSTDNQGRFERLDPAVAREARGKPEPQTANDREEKVKFHVLRLSLCGV